MLKQTTWVISGGTLGGLLPLQYLVTGHDSVINNVRYQIVYNHIDKQFVGLFREDTLARKVYRYSSRGEHIQYDFSLSLGETVTVNLFYYRMPTLAMRVMNVDTVELNGVKRKQLYLKGGPSYDEFYVTWIEGCGSTQGLLYDDYDRYCFDHYLECVYYALDLQFCSGRYIDCSSCPKWPVIFQWEKNCAMEPTRFYFDPIQTGFTGTIDFGDGSAYEAVSGKETVFHTYQDSGTFDVRFFLRRDGLLMDTLKMNIPVYRASPVQLANDTVLCDQGSFVLSPLTKLAGAYYEWRGPTNKMADDLTITKSGTYTVIQHLASCQASQDKITVQFISAQILDLGKDRVMCGEDTLHLSVKPGYASILWSTGETTSGVDIHKMNFTPQVFVEVDYSGCRVYDTVNLAQHDYPALSIHDTSFCEKDTLRLIMDNTLGSYTWSTNSKSNAAWFTKGGDHWVAVSTGYCSRKYAFSATEIPRPIVELGSDTVLCRKQALELSAPSAYAKRWSTGSSANSILAFPPETIFLTLTNQSCSATDSIRLSLRPAEHMDFVHDTTLCFWDGPLLIDLYGVGLSDYLFVHSNEKFSSLNAPGKWEWSVENRDGCALWDEAFITETCVEDMYIPSAFTPNGDGINDVFRVEGVLLSNFSIEIYTRWGERIYSSSDANFLWNGTCNGVFCQEGVYLYWMSFSLPNNKRKSYDGMITLLR